MNVQHYLLNLSGTRQALVQLLYVRYVERRYKNVLIYDGNETIFKMKMLLLTESCTVLSARPKNPHRNCKFN